MKQINLLPWREEARQIKKVNFGISAAFFSTIAIIFLVVMHINLSKKINQQRKTNSVIQLTLDKEKTRLSGMESKNQERKNFNEKLNQISNLMKGNYEIIALFNDLAAISVPNINVQSLEINNNDIVFNGEAVSDKDITLFMQMLSKSKHLSQPVLSKISNNEETGARQFRIAVDQKDRESNEA